MSVSLSCGIRKMFQITVDDVSSHHAGRKNVVVETHVISFVGQVIVVKRPY